MSFRHAIRRSWMLWGVHLFIYLLALGIVITTSQITKSVSTVIVLGWLGVLTLHFFYLVGMQSTSGPRKNEDLLEKPKRTGEYLTLGDDSELIVTDNEAEGQHVSRNT